MDAPCMRVPLWQSLLCPTLQERVSPPPQLWLLPPRRPHSTAGGGGGAWEEGKGATAGFGAGEEGSE